MLFGADAVRKLRAATDDLCWLLTRGYANASASALVGNRHQLTDRQRMAVQRCACADPARDARRSREVDALDGRPVVVDGYNVLTTVEAALSHGVLLRARDGCLRDLASMHGSWRRVEETEQALRLIGAHLGATPSRWLLDSPISNSGRLRSLMLRIAEEADWPWAVDLIPNVDATLRASRDIVASADSAVIDGCGPWCALGRAVVERVVPDAWVLCL